MRQKNRSFLLESRHLWRNLLHNMLCQGAVGAGLEMRMTRLCSQLRGTIPGQATQGVTDNLSTAPGMQQGRDIRKGLSEIAGDGFRDRPMYKRAQEKSEDHGPSLNTAPGLWAGEAAWWNCTVLPAPERRTAIRCCQFLSDPSQSHCFISLLSACTWYQLGTCWFLLCSPNTSCKLLTAILIQPFLRSRVPLTSSSLFSL